MKTTFFCNLLFFLSVLPSVLYSEPVDSEKLLHKYVNITTGKYSGKVVIDQVKPSEQVLLNEKNINSEFLNNFLIIKLDVNESVRDTQKILLKLKFISGWHFEDTLIVTSPYYSSIFCIDTIAKGKGFVSSYSLNLLAEPYSGKSFEIAYNLKLKSSIIHRRAIVYLAFVLIYTVIILYLLRWTTFTTLSEKKWHSKWATAISIISQVFLVIMLLDEIGLLLKEWNVSAGFFSLFRYILELPGLSQILLLANLGLVIPAGYSLSHIMIDQMTEANKDRFSEWRDLPAFKARYSMFIALFLMTLSVLFFLVQCFVFDEFRLNTGRGVIIDIVFVCLILALPVLVLYKLISLSTRINKENNPFRHQPWYEKESLFITLLVCFLSLAQTMITKVLLLFSIISWANPAISKLTGFLLKKARRGENRGSGRNYENLVRGLSVSPAIDRWNFIFLTTSFLPLILLFQCHCSPYPPSDSAFPKTETISSLYMVYMILFLFIRGKNWVKWLSSFIWLIVTVFILYFTPIFFPAWFFPSLDPPGFSFLDGVNQLSNEITASIILLIFHFFTAALLMLIYISTNIKQSLIDNSYENVDRFKIYFFLIVIIKSVLFLAIFPIFFYIIGKADIVTTAKFLSEYGIWNNFFGKVTSIFAILSALILIILNLGLKKDVAEIHSGIMDLAGEEAVNRIKRGFRLINGFKSWNKSKDKFHAYIIIFSPGLLLLLLNLFFLRFPAAGSREKVSLVWHYPLEDELTFYGGLRKYNKLITCFSPQAITAFNSGTGEKIWQIRKRIHSYEMTVDGKLCILSGNQLMMIECDSGKTIWSTNIQYESSDRKAIPKISVYKGIITVLLKNKVMIIDELTGSAIDQSEDINSKLSRSLGGLPCWASSSNHLLEWQSPGNTRDLINVKDSITDIYSFREGILAVTENEFLCVSGGHNFIWRKPLENGDYFSTASVVDSIVIIERKSGMFGYNLFDGTLLWARPEDSFVWVNHDPYRPAINSLALGNALARRLLTTDYKNMYLLDKKTGNIIKKFKNINDEHGPFRLVCVGISNDFICGFDVARMDVYDPDTAENLFYSFYRKPVFDLEPDYYKDNSMALNIYGLLFDGNIIYLSDSKGLSAIKIPGN